MRTPSVILQSLVLVLLTSTASVHAGKTWYVDAVSGADNADGTSSATAKRTLVAVMVCASDGDTVCALPGTYDAGTSPSPDRGNTLSRVVVPEGVRLVSRDGAATTVIVGARAPDDQTVVPEYGFGTNAVRCVSLSMRASLEGFTLTGGRTWADGTSTQSHSDYGAAVWAANADTCRIADCIISNNIGVINGICLRGAYVRCRFLDNRCTWYGMMTECRLVNCLLDGNWGNYVTHYPIAVVNCTFGTRNTHTSVRSAGNHSPVYNSLILCDVGAYVALHNCLVTGKAEASVKWLSGSRACASEAEARRLAVDGGQTNLYDIGWTAAVPFGTDGGTDLSGGPRVKGRRLDVGAEEHDFRDDFAEILLPNDAHVTDVSDTAYPDGAGNIVLPVGARMDFTVDHLTDDVTLLPSVRTEGNCAYDLVELGVGGWRLTAKGDDGLLRAGRIGVVLSGRDPNAFPLAGIGRDKPIVVANATRKSTLLAAEELAHYVKVITGRDLTVTNEDVAASRVIIGLADEIRDLPDAARTALGATSNLEAGWTGTDGTNLWIVGKSAVAELYAVYRFIETRLGVRWFKGATADDPGEWTPSSEILEIPSFAEFRQPDFAIRRLDKCSSHVTQVAVNGETCAIRNGYQVPPANTSYDDASYRAFYEARYPKRLYPMGGGHMTFLNAMPTNTFAAHPEYFGLYDGRRQCTYGHYCLSNPSVRSNAAEYALARLNTLGAHDGTYLFGMWDDSRGQCECAACQALDPWPMYRYSSTPDITTRFVATVNDIAGRIWARRPESELYMWAYLNYRKPPVGIRPDPRLGVQFCAHGRCYGHAIDDANCPINRSYCAWLREWCRLSGRVFTYEYYGPSAPHYSCHEMTEPRDLRFYKSLGMIGWKGEAYFSDARFIDSAIASHTDEIFPSDWQGLYVTGHLLWDTTIDEFALLADVESKYYGAAYPAMRDYHALRRSLWANNVTCMGYPSGNARRPRLLDAPQSRERLLAYIDDAERLAADDPLVLRRIAADRDWLERYWIAPFASRSADGEMLALRRNARIVIDGTADEDAWSGAVSFTNLSETIVTALYDDEALYFLIQAEADGSSDGVEAILDPPLTNALRRTRLVFGRDGSVGGVSGTTAAVRTTDLGWQIEARVPAAEVFPLRDQDVWRIRLRRTRDGVAWATDAGEDDDLAAYRPLFIGVPFLTNPSFRKRSTQNVLPADWAHVNGGTSVAMPFGSGNLLSVSNGVYHSAYAHPLGQAESERPFDVTVRAHGTGTLTVSTLEYSDTYGPQAGYSYHREGFGTIRIKKFQLKGESRAYEAHHVIPTNRWCSILLGREGNGSVFAESVSLRPCVPTAERTTLRKRLDACAEGTRIETYETSGDPVTNGAQRTLAITGLTGSAAELPSVVSESTIVELTEKLSLPVRTGFVVRPTVTESGTLGVRYAATPEFKATDDTPPVRIATDADGTVLTLDVTNPVGGFWYGLLSAESPAGPFERDGTAMQHTGSAKCTLDAEPSSDPSRFYRATVWPTNPTRR